MMRILIVGAGALGGYFGARLLAAGQDVTFLVRPARAAQLAAHGLHLVSPLGDLTVPSPSTVLAESIHGHYDLILLSPKAHDLAAAMDSLAPAVGPATLILPLLNGLAHMQALDERFGAAHVLGGSTPISAVRDPDGVIRHLNTIDTLTFGARDEPASPRMERVHAMLRQGGFEVVLSPNILHAMWMKWISIATAAGSTCLLRASTGDIVAAGAAPLVRQLLAECSSIASAEGFPPAEAELNVILAKWTQPGSSFTASMLRDLEAGAPIESQQIVGDLLLHARRHPLATPLLAVVHAHLRCYEIRRQRELQAGQP